jgi:thiamine monophosphate kinase
MIGAKIYGVASTIVGAATMGAAAAPAVPLHTVAPTDIPFIGPVPIFAVGVGVLTALLVRVIVGASDKNKLLSYNLAVTGIAVLGTATFIIDHQVGPGNSFWVGGSFGAAGAGTVSVMRSKFFVTIWDAVRSGLVKSIGPTDDAPKS